MRRAMTPGRRPRANRAARPLDRAGAEDRPGAAVPQAGAGSRRGPRRPPSRLVAIRVAVEQQVQARAGAQLDEPQRLPRRRLWASAARSAQVRLTSLVCVLRVAREARDLVAMRAAEGARASSPGSPARRCDHPATVGMCAARRMVRCRRAGGRGSRPAAASAGAGGGARGSSIASTSWSPAIARAEGVERRAGGAVDAREAARRRRAAVRARPRSPARAVGVTPASSGGSARGPSGYSAASCSGVISSVLASLRRRADDEPQRVGVGVVEELRTARARRARSTAARACATRRRCGSAGALEHDVELGLRRRGGASSTPGRAPAATSARRAWSPRAAWRGWCSARPSGWRGARTRRRRAGSAGSRPES